MWFFFFHNSNNKSHNGNYLRGWRKIRQGSALGVWGRPFGVRVGASFSGLGLDLLSGLKKKNIIIFQNSSFVAPEAPKTFEF